MLDFACLQRQVRAAAVEGQFFRSGNDDFIVRTGDGQGLSCGQGDGVVLCLDSDLSLIGNQRGILLMNMSI